MLIVFMGGNNVQYCNRHAGRTKLIYILTQEAGEDYGYFVFLGCPGCEEITRIHTDSLTGRPTKIETLSREDSGTYVNMLRQKIENPKISFNTPGPQLTLLEAALKAYLESQGN
jgi:hypothetical protein